MMMRLFSFLCVIAFASAFVPPQSPRGNAQLSSSSALQFKFLKELGLEKPSWLPDFGKKEEVVAEEAPAEEEEETEEEAAAEE